MSEPAAAPTEVPQPLRPRAAARQAWAERLARFADSGLAPALFCAREGVSLPSFYSWKRRLNAPPLQTAADHTPGGDPGPRLLSVRLPSPAPAIELVLPMGAVLRLSPGCDLAFVRQLLDALGEAPC